MLLSEHLSIHKDIFLSKTIIDLFQSSVAWYPDKSALQDGETHISYRELDQLSNRLAQYLAEYDHVVPGSIIGISTGRSYMTIVSRLAIWKAGGTCVVLDPGCPSTLTVLCAKLGNISVIIDETYVSHALESISVNIDFKSLCSPDQLAIILFTSGSTGTPKGVRILHSNIAATASHYDALSLQSSDNFATFASPTFIASVADLSMALSIGATFIIIPTTICKSAQQLAEFYIQNHVTATFLPPHMAIKYITMDEGSPLRILLVGSEPARNLDKRPYEIINVYAASEACATISCYYISDYKHSYPIGKLLSFLKGYIVAEDGTLAKPGEPGELWLGGPQIFDGYIGASELNETQFVDNPFEPDCSPAFRRLYKTSDIVKQLPDGNMEFVCRKGHMYKVRGFRVEIEGIETHLQSFPGVKAAAVSCFTDAGGTNILFGFYSSNEKLDHTKLRQHLAEHLPYYCVPTCLIYMDALPRTTSGKIDRKKLQPPPELNDHKKLAILYY